jgi:coiled-coil domain-containing protein 61
MMLSALRSETETVYIDLLTYQDLETLKSRGNNTTQNNTSVNNSTNKKRYLILTYIGEFEKVHFPLPLNFIDEPDADALRRTIDRMRN